MTERPLSPEEQVLLDKINAYRPFFMGMVLQVKSLMSPQDGAALVDSLSKAMKQTARDVGVVVEEDRDRKRRPTTYASSGGASQTGSVPEPAKVARRRYGHHEDRLIERELTSRPRVTPPRPKRKSTAQPGKVLSQLRRGP